VVCINQQPIGVFDSGVGGLSVLRQINLKLPSESTVYFGDTAHVPYGGRELNEVKGFALSICDFLVSQGVKMVVMACNISSAVAIDEARALWPTIPIIGVIEPGATAAIESSSIAIGVLATQGTVTSGAYTRVVTRLDCSAVVTEVACPKFVPIVEAELMNSPEAFHASVEYLAPLSAAKCRAIILGCTHYPFLQHTLASAAAELFPHNGQPTFIDPALETANQIGNLLSTKSILNPAETPPTRTYYVSGPPQQFQQSGTLFLGEKIETVNQHVS
jgi:glutamate racemase